MPLTLENLQIVEGFPPVDMSVAANNGDWVSLKHYNRIAIVFAGGIGTNGEDPTLTIKQATDVSGTSAKDLTFTTIYRKQAATSLASTGTWTKTTQTAAATYSNTDAAEQAFLWVVEFKAEDLDIANGFDCVRATVADVGVAAQPGYLFYILSEPRFHLPVASMLSAIAD